MTTVTPLNSLREEHIMSTLLDVLRRNSNCW
jgi:hypothetical protein